MTADAALGGGDKIQQRGGGGAGERLSRFGERHRYVFAGAKKQVIEALQLKSRLRSQARATQSDDIQSAKAVDIPATRDGKWRQIAADGGAALHQCEGSDPHKLVNDSVSGDKHVIPDLNMPS